MIQLGQPTTCRIRSLPAPTRRALPRHRARSSGCWRGFARSREGTKGRDCNNNNDPSPPGAGTESSIPHAARLHQTNKSLHDRLQRSAIRDAMHQIRILFPSPVSRTREWANPEFAIRERYRPTHRRPFERRPRLGLGVLQNHRLRKHASWRRRDARIALLHHGEDVLNQTLGIIQRNHCNRLNVQVQSGLRAPHGRNDHLPPNEINVPVKSIHSIPPAAAGKTRIFPTATQRRGEGHFCFAGFRV